MNLKESIKKKLEKYSKAYYEGNALVPDHVYDSLENFYQQLVGEFDPFEVRKENYRTTVKHWSRLSSLSKSYNIKDIFEKIGNDYIVEPKFDGLSLSFQYINSKFYKAVTRGDGEKGNDVTHMIKPYLENTYNNLLELDTNKPITLQVRGEFIIPVEEEDYFLSKGFKSIRNVASGLINKKEYDKDIEKCEFMVHDYYFVDKQVYENDRQLVKSKLRSLGFMVAKDCSHLIKGKDTIIEEKHFQNGLTFIIDGYVFKTKFKTNELDKQGYPKDAMAFKSEDRINTLSSVIGIKWSMPNDKLVPKFVLEPVDMGGSTIQYASAHNYDYIYNLVGKLKENNVVSLIKAGDIIPQVKDIVDYGNGEDVLSLERVPKSCPYCKEPLVKESVHLMCVNPDCFKKVVYRINKLVDILEIKNIGKKTILALVKHFKVKSFGEFYNLKASDWEEIEGLGKKSYKAFKESADERLSEFGVEELLISLAIPLHGEKTIRTFRRVWKTDSIKDLMLSKDNLVKITNYSEYKYNILKENLLKMKDIVMDLKPFIRKKYVEDDTTEVKGNVMVTGKDERYTRKEIKKILAEMGYNMVSSISNADILLCSDLNSNSSKMKKARDKGIEIKLYKDMI